MASQASFSISFQQQSGRLSIGFNGLQLFAVGNYCFSRIDYRVLHKPALAEVRLTVLFFMHI